MKTKITLITAQLLIASNLFAGGVSGGSPPAKGETKVPLEISSTMSELELAKLADGLDLDEGVSLPHQTMADLLKAATDNRPIAVKLGPKTVTLKPASFDFTKKELQLNVIENGAALILKEAELTPATD